MPATPAWPAKSLPRLFLPTPLGEGAVVPLDGPQANYLGNVMRLGEGRQVLLFDGVSGEWRARIAEVAKRRMLLVVEERTRPPEVLPDVWLAFAPVKRGPVEWPVEKATELGVARLMPVVTARTVVERLRVDRLQLIAIEAAEQCGRTVLPQIDAPTPLSEWLEARDAARGLLFADEGGGEAMGTTSGPVTILIGPEGGFTDEERAAIRTSPGASAVTLGPRILRAETAALGAVAVCMALRGEWR